MKKALAIGLLLSASGAISAPMLPGEYRLSLDSFGGCKITTVSNESSIQPTMPTMPTTPTTPTEDAVSGLEQSSVEPMPMDFNSPNDEIPLDQLFEEDNLMDPSKDHGSEELPTQASTLPPLNIATNLAPEPVKSITKSSISFVPGSDRKMSSDQAESLYAAFDDAAATGKKILVLFTMPTNHAGYKLQKSRISILKNVAATYGVAIKVESDKNGTNLNLFKIKLI